MTVDGGISADTVTFICMLIFDIIFICGGNALVIIIFARTPALRIISNASIVNLAFADLCIGLYTIVLLVKETFTELTKSYEHCRVNLAIAISIFLVSIATLTGEYPNLKLRS